MLDSHLTHVPHHSPRPVIRQVVLLMLLTALLVSLCGCDFSGPGLEPANAEGNSAISPTTTVTVAPPTLAAVATATPVIATETPLPPTSTRTGTATPVIPTE